MTACVAGPPALNAIRGPSPIPAESPPWGVPQASTYHPYTQVRGCGRQVRFDLLGGLVISAGSSGAGIAMAVLNLNAVGESEAVIEGNLRVAFRPRRRTRREGLEACSQQLLHQGLLQI